MNTSKMQFCGTCGAPNDHDAAFCASCGRGLSSQPTAAPVQPTTRRINKLAIACMIAMTVVITAGAFVLRSYFSGRTGGPSSQQTLLKPMIFVGHDASVKSIAISPDSRQLLSGGGYQDDSVRLWDVQTGKEIRKFVGHSTNTEVVAVAFTPDPDVVMSAGAVDDFTLRFWNTLSGAETRQVKGTLETGIFEALSADTHRALAVQLGGSHAGGGFSLWDTDRGREVRQFECRGAGPLVFSPDGMSAAIGGNGIVQLWDLANGRVRQTLNGHGKDILITSIAFEASGKRLLSAGTDKTVRLWDIQTGKQLSRFAVNVGTVSALAFSPDGRLAVTGSEDKIVRLWSLATGASAEIERFEGHTDGITAVAYSPNGHFIVSGSNDRTLRLWPVRETL